MAETEEIELAAEPPKSRKGLIIIIVVALLVLGGGTGGALFALGMLPGGSSAEASTAADGAPAEAAAPTRAEAVYVPLDPAFTVNFRGGAGARYLQVAVEAMTRDPDVEAQIKRHMPVIRNDLTMLFSSKSARDLSTTEGKEALRSETLASIQKVLQSETGKPGVEAVYFTSFVMQ